MASARRLALCLACALVFLMPWHAARAQSSEQCAVSYENAQLFRLRGRFVEAHEALLACAQASCPAFIRTDCTNWLPEVEASLPSVVFAVTDQAGHDIANVRLYVDGKPLTGHAPGRALALDPGSYALRVEAPDFQSVEQVVTVREAEKNRILRVRLVHAPRGGVSVPRATWVLAGVSAAGLATFAGFAIAGKREYDALQASCGNTCSHASTQKGRTLYILADVGIGVAAASATAALWVYFAQRKKLRRDGRPSLEVDATHALLGFRQRF